MVLLANAAHAQESYLVTATIRDGETVIASPAFLIEPGKRASVSEGDKYHLFLKASQRTSDTLSVETELLVSGEHLSSKTLIFLGEQSQFQVNDLDLAIRLTRHIPNDA